MCNKGTNWSESDVNRLATLYFSIPKPSIETMAADLGRTPMACFTEMSKLGLAKPGAKLRRCLGHGCQGQKSFFSSGIGERMCSFCKGSEIVRYA